MRQTTLATLDMAALTAAFNLVYTDYLVPLTLDERQMARHVAVNDIDLTHSPLWLDDDGAVVGMAALGVRGERGWVGGFGVAPDRRGQGLGNRFAAATLDAARSAGLRTVQLEVITGNTRAIRAYERVGFRVTRDLRILVRPADAPAPGGADARVRAGDAEALLQRALVDRPVAPPWQREPTALARGGPLGSLVVGDPLVPRAFALFAASERGVIIADLTARDPGDAQVLLDAIAREHSGRALSVFNVPTDDPAAPAFDAASFRETLRQHEMCVDLA